jgi:hypothetical protein
MFTSGVGQHCVAGWAFIKLGLQCPTNRGAFASCDQLIANEKSALDWCRKNGVRFTPSAMDRLNDAQEDWDCHGEWPEA